MAQEFRRIRLLRGDRGMLQDRTRDGCMRRLGITEAVGLDLDLAGTR